MKTIDARTIEFEFEDFYEKWGKEFNALLRFLHGSKDKDDRESLNERFVGKPISESLPFLCELDRIFEIEDDPIEELIIRIRKVIK